MHDANSRDACVCVSAKAVPEIKYTNLPLRGVLQVPGFLTTRRTNTAATTINFVFHSLFKFQRCHH